MDDAQPSPSNNEIKEENQIKEKTANKPLKGRKKHKYSWLVWGVSVLFISFALTVLFSFITEIAIADSQAYVSIIVLVVLLIINIGCDMIANAFISCTNESFLAMASNKVKGAKRAVTFCKHSTKLSSIFADIIGDICGIVSGAAGTALVVHFAAEGSVEKLIASILISAVIGGLTVGGKAIFKHFAVKFNRQIVFGFARFTTFFVKEK